MLKCFKSKQKVQPVDNSSGSVHTGNFIISVLREILALLIIFVHLFVLPFHVGFNFNTDNSSEPVPYNVWTCLMILSDIFFIGEIISKRSQAQAQIASLLAALASSSSQASLKDKLLSNSFWGYGSFRALLTEVICSLPFDLFCPVFGQYIYIIRNLKLTRCFLMFAYSKRILLYLSSIGHEVDLVLVRLSRDLFIMFYLAHQWGCYFMLIARYHCGFKLDNGCIASWAISDNLTGTSTIHQYARAYLWGILTDITIGYGDIVPHTDLEVLYTTIFFMPGFMMQNQIIANFGFYFSKTLQTKIRFEGVLDNFKKFFQRKKISEPLQDRIFAYFEYLQKQRHGVSEDEIVDHLPPQIKRDVVSYLQTSSVGQVYLWRGRSAAFFSQLQETLKLKSYSPEDFIFREKTLSSFCYILHKGQAAKIEKNKNIGLLEEGSPMNEMALFDSSLPCDVTVKAVTFCEAYYLDAKSFYSILISLYGEEEAVEHLELMKEKAISNGKSKGKSNKMLGKDEESTSISKNDLWKLPKSPFRLYWDALVFLSFVFYLFEVPFRICFAQFEMSKFYASPFGTENKIIWTDICINVICSIVMITDMIFQARYYYFYKTAHTGLKIVIKDGGSIWKEYRSTYFFSDFVSSIPFFLVSFFVRIDGFIYMSLFRLFRLVKYNAYLENFLMVLIERGYSINSNGMRLIKLLTQVFISIHITGCIFIFIGKYQFSLRNDALETPTDYYWPRDPHMSLGECEMINNANSNCTWLDFDNNKYASIFVQYLRSFYWSSNIFSTVGYGDIKPVTTLETLYDALWVYFGAMYFYMACGLISAFTEQGLATANKNQDMIENLNLFMSDYKIPHDLRHQIRKYFRYIFQFNQGIDEKSLLDILPNSLRDEIVFEMYESKVKGVDLFKGLDSECIKGLVGRLNQQIYLEGDYIVREGDLGNLLFIINLGRVEIIAPDKVSVIASLCEGNYFGEATFMLKTRRTVYVQAVSLCHTTYLSHADFESVINIFPGQYDIILKKASLQRDADAKVNAAVSKNLKNNNNVKNKFQMVSTEGLYLRKSKSESNEFTEFFKLYLCSKKKRKITKVVVVLATDSTIRLVWSFIILLVTGFTFYYIPFRIAYLNGQDGFEYFLYLLPIDLLVDILFMIDIYLKIYHFGFDGDDGELVTDGNRIYETYKKGHFYYDIFAALPLYYPNSFICGIVRTVKLLKFLQVGEYFDDSQELMNKFYSKFNSKITSLMQLILLSIGVAHYFGCIFFLISYIQMSSGASKYGWIGNDNIYNNQTPIPKQYTRSLYWAFEALTVICFGDIISQNEAETFWATLCCLTGFVLISNVIGIVSDTVASLDKSALNYDNKVNLFIDYASKTGLPFALKEKILKYYEFDYQYSKGGSQTEIYERLPLAYKYELSKIIMLPILQNCWLFKKLSAGMLRNIAMLMKSNLYIPADTIIHQGDVSRHFHILNHGLAELFSIVDNCVFATLSKGQAFGFISFFLPQTRNICSVRAASYCEVLSIEREDWDELVAGTLVSESMVRQSESYLAMEKNIFRNIRNNLNKATDQLGCKLQKLLINQNDYDLAAMVDKKSENDAVGHEKHRSFTEVVQGSLAFTDANKSEEMKVEVRRRSSLDRRSQKIIESHLEEYVRDNANFEREKKMQEEKIEKEKLEKEKLDREEVPQGGEESKSKKKYTISNDFKESDDQTSYVDSALKVESILQEEKKRGRRVSNAYSSASNFKLQHQKSILPVSVPIFNSNSAERMSFTSEKPVEGNGKKMFFSVIVNPKPPYHWMVPMSSFRQYWEIINMFQVVYYSIIMPFRLCYMLDNDPYWLPLDNVVRLWFTLEAISDAFILLHMIFNLRFFAFYLDGELVTDTFRISRKYLRGWFFIDAIALCPIDYIAMQFFPSTYYFTLTVFRMNKLVFALRIFNSLDNVEDIIKASFSRLRPSLVKVLRWTFIYCLVGHYTCCVFYLIGMKSGGYGSYVPGADASTLLSDGGWMSNVGAVMNPGETINDVSIARVYLRSYYFCIGAMTTVAYGDIKPLTYAETIYLLFVIFYSMGLLGSGISVMRASLNDLYQSEADFDENLRKIIGFFVNMNFETSLIERVKVYYKHAWQRKLLSNSQSLLVNLPHSLRTEISLFVNYELVEKVDLFEKCEQGFVDAIVVALKPQVLLPNDVLIKEGEVGNEMYFVNSGILSVFNDIRSFSAKKKYGDYVGEVALLLNRPRNANVIADTECDLMVFTRADYENILKFYPEYREINRKKWIKSSHYASENNLKADSNILNLFRNAKSKIVAINALSKKAIRATLINVKVKRVSTMLKSAVVVDTSSSSEETNNNASATEITSSEVTPFKESFEEEEEEVEKQENDKN